MIDVWVVGLDTTFHLSIDKFAAMTFVQ